MRVCICIYIYIYIYIYACIWVCTHIRFPCRERSEHAECGHTSWEARHTAAAARRGQHQATRFATDTPPLRVLPFGTPAAAPPLDPASLLLLPSASVPAAFLSPATRAASDSFRPLFELWLSTASSSPSHRSPLASEQPSELFAPSDALSLLEGSDPLLDALFESPAVWFRVQGLGRIHCCMHSLSPCLVRALSELVGKIRGRRGGREEGGRERQGSWDESKGRRSTQGGKET
jgi:hypothetical protein